MQARFTSVADHALLVTFADEIGDDAHAAVLSLDCALAEDPPHGMIEMVPALVNILIDFDPLQTDHGKIQAEVKMRLENLTPMPATGATRCVQICYDGPDLDVVAQATGLPPDAVINAHLAGDYQALMYGFAPGYAYLAGVPDAIQVPRKPSAVRDVPAGSVIIAGPQCLVTTLKMPTGWSILGRSPTPILTGDQDRPFLFSVGDRIVFERITPDQCDRAQDGAGHG
ncbi:MAG: allophanate hydrolase subunit 1 [Pseudomonadota bacterium]